MTMYVITHKEFHYNLPKGYVPILVGADVNQNPQHYQPDNQGDNISSKNPSFCELTGLYWMWKNSHTQNIGLSHYRRYFSKYSSRKDMYLAELIKGHMLPVSEEMLDGFLNDYDWIVSQPEKGGQGSVYDQFKEFHNIKDLQTVRDVIKENHPNCVPAFDHVMNSEFISFYNMFYTSKENADQYCEWLFDVLFEVEKRTDISNYDSYQQRLYGFLGERLLNVWLQFKQPKIKYLAEYQTDKLTRKMVVRKFWHKLS